MKRRIVAALSGIIALWSLVAPASALEQSFNNPMQGPNRLDWCLNWGVGCGADAAHAWCVANGFTSATNFAIANDIGASSPTRLITTGAVCDQGFCDGFAQITCFRPTPSQNFANPSVNGNRLDWCFAWGTGCGEQAADAFCAAQGFAAASSWGMAEDIGASSPTRLISTGAVCDQGFCDGFSNIQCTN